MQSVRLLPLLRRWPLVALVLAHLLAGPLAAQDRVTLKLAATTDVHGRLRGWDYGAGRVDSTRGLARAASIIDSLRRSARDRVILVDAGDLLQGNAMTFVAGRVDSLAPHPVIAAMNLMRYDAAAVGNHEFNYGLNLFDRAVSQARFPFLAANTRRLDGGHQYPGRTIVTRAGVKVAIIGVTTPGSMVWDRDNLKGRLAVDDIVAALPAEVAAARTEGADVVIVVAHAGLDGLTSYDTLATGLPSENPMARVAREVAGIDALVIGHSHREVTDTTINGVLVVQPRNWATSVAVVSLELQRQDGRWTLVSKRGETVQARGWPEQQAIVRAVERAHRAAVRYATSAVGRTSVAWITDSARMVDRPMIDLIQEVQRKVSGAELSIASVFTTAARFEPGSITVERLVDLYPYENTLRALRLSGRQIRDFLEYTQRYWIVERDSDGALRVRNDPSIPGYNYDALAGLEYTVDLGRPMGRRITSLTRGGRPVADMDTFTVALNSYRASGGGGYDMLRGAPIVYEGSREIRELIIEEIRRRGAIEPQDVFQQNWSVIPPSNSLRIIAMNDMHGAFRGRPDGAQGTRGGFSEIATMVRAAREGCAPTCAATLLLSGGDLFTGTPAADLSTGAAVVPVLNAMGFAAHALGNHEFDYGQDTLRARMRQLSAPVLGANVTYADGRDVEWIPNDTLLRTLAGNVGIIGIADPATARTAMPRYVADLRFADPVPAIRVSAQALRERGAGKVILVAHLGGFCTIDNPDDCRGEIFDLARALGPGVVDAIVSGHTHSAVNTVVAGIPIVQARSSTRALGIIDLPMNAGEASRPQLLPVVTDSTAQDPVIERLVAAAVAAVAPRVSALVVTSEARFPRQGDQYALGNLIADAQRAAGRADVGLMNNGGIRAELREGPVTYGDLHEIQPFANRLVAITVRGDALRAYFERLVQGSRINVHLSGVTIDYDAGAPAGSRLRRVVMADGRPLDDRRTYRVVMSDFLASGGDGVGLSGGQAPEDLGVVDLEALIAHLKRTPGGRLALTEALSAPRIRSRR